MIINRRWSLLYNFFFLFYIIFCSLFFSLVFSCFCFLFLLLFLFSFKIIYRRILLSCYVKEEGNNDLLDDMKIFIFLFLLIQSIYRITTYVLMSYVISISSRVRAWFEAYLYLMTIIRPGTFLYYIQFSFSFPLFLFSCLLYT